MRDLALGEAGLEPAHPLGRSAVGKRVWHYAPLALLLQAVIANGVGRVQCRLDVAGFQPVQAFLCAVGPHPGKAVGLQFLAYQQAAIALHLPTLLTRSLDLGRDAQQRLHVVPDFVGDHIGLGEFAGCLEALGHFPEEIQVQVHLLVGRAVERAAGRGGATTG